MAASYTTGTMHVAACKGLVVQRPYHWVATSTHPKIHQRLLRFPSWSMHVKGAHAIAQPQRHFEGALMLEEYQTAFGCAACSLCNLDSDTRASPGWA